MDKVNCSIPLAETHIEVCCDRGTSWRSMPAKVTMRLSPVPRVFIEITTPRRALALENSLYRFGAETKLRLPSGPEIEAFVMEWAVGAVWRSLLIPTQQPVTVRQTEEPLRSVKFSVINYPGLSQRAHPLQLCADPWRIEIKPVADFSEIKNILKMESGYAVTHEGSIRRSDGESFSVEEAHKLLDGLRLFLSFARGGDCGVTLITGRDENDDPAWEQWGTYPAYPWFDLSSWLDHRLNNDDALSTAFPGFWRKVGQTTGVPDHPVRVALYWYLRSNESNALQAGIILTQAALERLACQLLPNERYKTLNSAARKIRAVLQEKGIDTVIPQCCKELRMVRKTKGFCDGPEILSEIRNDLVHAKMRTNVCLEAYLEARDLGQWYVELLLLRLFEYTGQYANRLAYEYEGRWKPEIVPWAQLVEEANSKPSESVCESNSSSSDEIE